MNHELLGEIAKWIGIVLGAIATLNNVLPWPKQDGKWMKIRRFVAAAALLKPDAFSRVATSVFALVYDIITAFSAPGRVDRPAPKDPGK